MTFAERVKNLRKSRNLTQEELARRSGVGLGLISKIERGDNKEPKLSTLEKIINGLQVSADKLIPSENEQGLKGILKNKLEVLNELPAEDIRSVIRIIDNLNFEQRIKTSIVELKDNPYDQYESEQFIKEIEERESQEYMVRNYEEELERNLSHTKTLKK